MSIEAATYISTLQPLNPPSTDPRSQGDDHLRLIKQVLQNSFPSLNTPFYVSSNAGFTASGSISKTTGNGVNFVSTASGAVTLTLPTLVAGDGFWQTTIIKYSFDANPMFIIPPGAQNIVTGGQSLTRARRCIPGIAIQVFWDGTNYHVSRAVGLPVGSCIEFHGSALPPGYEWPNGQTLSSAANYPEYNALMGGLTTLDKRGRVGVPLDNLGGTDSGRLNTAGCALQGVRTTLGGSGGSGSTTLVLGNLPPYTPAGTVATTTTISSNANVRNAFNFQVGGTTGALDGAATITASSTSTFTGTAQGGTSTAFNNTPVSIMVSQILVVE